MSVPKDLKYTKTHEWIRVEGTTAVSGITDHAVTMLSDLVYVDLPELGGRRLPVPAELSRSPPARMTGRTMGRAVRADRHCGKACQRLAGKARPMPTGMMLRGLDRNVWNP